ncbi:energy transducer TonB [Rubrivirga sp. IMCC45206]|uniref:energy transducer TonB n=1 Tax=Rubrivirga sp. IMCC45206 TaxID=3391614 RepID=UPI00398FA8BA
MSREDTTARPIRPLLLAALVLTAADALARAPPPPPPPQADDNTFICRIETQPVLIGGIDALQSAVVYPEAARAERIEGQVVVQVIVELDGQTSDRQIVRSPEDRLSPAALAAVRQMRFEPGRQRGEPVRVRLAVPVTFRLPDAERW